MSEIYKAPAHKTVRGILKFRDTFFNQIIIHKGIPSRIGNPAQVPIHRLEEGNHCPDMHRVMQSCTHTCMCEGYFKAILKAILDYF
jgi:hypothetical protein